MLKQPSPAFYIEPVDVYGEAGGEPSFPEDFVRIELDDIRWLRSFCDEALGVVKDRDDPADDERYRKAVWLLTTLGDFCDNALELGVRPVISRN